MISRNHPGASVFVVERAKIDLLLLFVRNVLNYSALVLDLDSVRYRFLVSNFELDMMITHGVAIRGSQQAAMQSDKHRLCGPRRGLLQEHWQHHR